MSKITNFPITVYGKKEKFSDTMTRGRCRVFYKGHNRNGTYITDNFAKKLIESAPYTPVKGIYSVDDYTDHGKARDEGRIYGIVPANPNFAWEKHEDENGVLRDYACFDVLYYTALYSEATEIMGKGESMELYRGTLKGAWQYIEGKKAYVFSDGCFLGLQVLGDDVEPCFEGASFYSNQEDSILAILEKYEKRPDLFQSPEQGGNIMNINFKLSDSQKHDLLFSSLNPNFNEDGGWTIECGIFEVYDEYALVVNYESHTFERVYYTKNEDTVEITARERCYIVDINDAEKEALDNLKQHGTFAEISESIEDKNNTIGTLNTKIEENNIKITDLENQVTTLTTEKEEALNSFTSASEELTTANASLETLKGEYTTLEATNVELNNTVSELNNALQTVTEERNALEAFKKNAVDTEKKNVISNYTELLDADVIADYTNRMDEYTVKELDMHLTYECKQVNPTIFSKNVEPQAQYVPKDENPGCGINDILARYEKK